MGRGATAADVREICLSLPETGHGMHGCARYPGTGEQHDDLLVIRTRNAADKAAPVVQLSRLGERDVEELREIITDAWRSLAPKRLAKQHLSDEQGPDA